MPKLLNFLIKKTTKKTKTVMLISLFLKFIFLLYPLAVQAQYNPHKQKSNITSLLSSYATNIIEMIVIFVTVYAMFILLIAGILFITSGGDEDRMDTAIIWTKRSALSVLIAMIIYFGAGTVIEFLFKLSEY